MTESLANFCWVQECSDSECVLSIYVQPGAKKSEIVGLFNEQLKVKISSPPVDGAANKELIKFLADAFGCRKSQLELLHGETSRNKKLSLHGVSLGELRLRLQTGSQK